MAIQMGGTGRSEVADINMTPMIDVLLVLLVIFMIAQPLLQKTIDVQLPIENNRSAAQLSTHIVLEITAAGEYTINTRPVASTDLQSRLEAIYRDRTDKVLFLKAHPDVIYQEVIGALDAARGAGVRVLGAVLPK